MASPGVPGSRPRMLSAARTVMWCHHASAWAVAVAGAAMSTSRPSAPERISKRCFIDVILDATRARRDCVETRILQRSHIVDPPADAPVSLCGRAFELGRGLPRLD